MESIERMQLLSDKIIEHINKNTLTYDYELQIFEVLLKKYNFRTIQDYAKERNLTYNGVLNQMRSGKVPYQEICGTKYIFM
jgi:hypothetical protein